MINNYTNISDLYTLSVLLCKDHGNAKKINLTHFNCDCDNAWFGPNCSIPGYTQWGNNWIAFQSVYAILYAVMFAATCHKFIDNLRRV